MLTYAPGSKGRGRAGTRLELSTLLRSSTPARPDSRSTRPETSTSTERCTRCSVLRYGVFVAPAADVGNPQTNPSRTIPWDTKTELTPGFTTNVALDSSGEILVGNTVLKGPSSSRSCQGRMNVFAAGSSGGTTDVKPLRILQFDGVLTSDQACYSITDPRPFYFPAISLFGTILFVADDFNDAIDAYPADASGNVKPTLTIAGSATQLDVPIALSITKLSGRAMAGPVNHHPDALHAQ